MQKLIKIVRRWGSTSKKDINKEIEEIKEKSQIRSFCIIAHIDHGKSTLADRLLELTGTIVVDSDRPQYLDKLQVERERGITVKAQSASMFYSYQGQKYLLNLIDTPGHVDFQYEVSRSMLSCEGCILLVDALQGVQAQTISNYELAYLQNLHVIPVINKIDVENVDIEQMEQEIKNSLGLEDQQVLGVSAKTGLNVSQVIERIINEVPPPLHLGDSSDPFIGYLVDSWFIQDQGVVLLLQIRSGYLHKGHTLVSCSSHSKYEVFEVGLLHPENHPLKRLSTGQVGYVYTNMKNAKEATVGDTFHLQGHPVQPLPGFTQPKPMVFAGIYPDDPAEFIKLKNALVKLSLTDPSVTMQAQSSAALGNGFRCGFLGLLHMDVVKQRLDDEYQVQSTLCTPSVSYRAQLKSGEQIVFDNALDAPDPSTVKYFLEPFAEVTLLVPHQSLNHILSLCADKRGEQIALSALDNKDKYMVKYILPMAEIITDFFDQVKSITRGLGSLDFEFKHFRPSDIKKMVILIMGEPVDALSFMVHQDQSEAFGKKLCKKLKDQLPGEQFTVVIQAQYGKRVVAREEVKGMRKDVTAKCYGGDFSRKKKLLETQKKGKSKLRNIGSVSIDKDTFKNILRMN